jgi:hypothetical protein
VPVSCAVVVGIFIPYLGRERSDANRGPGSESCNTTCRTEYNAAEQELRKLHVAAKLPCGAAFSAASQIFHGELPQIGSPRFMGLMIPQAGDTFELFGTLRDLSGYGVYQDLATRTQNATHRGVPPNPVGASGFVTNSYIQLVVGGLFPVQSAGVSSRSRTL